VFASSLCGALTLEKTLYESLKIAVDYTVESINATIDNPNHNWYGVDFERAIPKLINMVK
jgi:pyridoxine kinase